MKLFDQDSSIRWLFCPTHPDDELGVCAFIRRIRLAGAEVYINWTHATSVRKEEAIRAAAIMGVPAENLSFMDGEDGHIREQMPSLLPLFRSLVERVKPDRVVCIAFEQGHLDHDSTNFLVNRAFGGPVLEWPMYHPYTRRIQTMGRFSDPTGEEILALKPFERQFKRRMSWRYPSQNIRSVLVGYHILRSLQFRPARLHATERLRLCPPHDYSKPTVEPKYFAEVETSEMWRRWLESYEKLRA